MASFSICPDLQILSSSIAKIDSGLNLDITRWILKIMNNIVSSQSIVHTLAKGSPIEISVGLMLLFSSMIWLLSYQIGLFLNLRYAKISKPRRFLYHLQSLLLCPIIGVVETFPAFCAILEHNIGNKIYDAKRADNYDFYVIRK